MRQLNTAVMAYNAAVTRVNVEAPTERQHRRPLVLAEEVASLGADLAPGDSEARRP